MSAMRSAHRPIAIISSTERGDPFTRSTYAKVLPGPRSASGNVRVVREREELTSDRVYGLREFAEAEAEFTDWAAARSWTSGDGPKAIGWLGARLDQLAQLLRAVRPADPMQLQARLGRKLALRERHLRGV